MDKPTKTIIALSTAALAVAYHGPLTKAGALAERVLPRALTRRIAAFMNGGKPHTLKV